MFQIAPESNIRLSYQTAYRFPTNQDQYINLNVGSGLLIGLLPEFQTYYGLNTNPGYTAESVTQYRTSGNASALKQGTFAAVKPESVQSYEVGYKGILAKKLFLDIYGYYSNTMTF